MNLGTTGAILSFALEREVERGSFYDKCISTMTNSELKDAFDFIKKEQKKRERLLNRFRRENVTEMILEPIHDFDSESFELGIALDNSLDNSYLRETAIKIEESSYSFFLRASEKTKFLPEVSEEFKRLSDKTEKYISLLKSSS
jgi:hypothetical protein